jgi:hypothetical protein
MNLERILLDDGALPYTSHELVLSDELTGRLNENRKDRERSAPHRNRDSARPQFTPREIYLPSVKNVHHVSALVQAYQRTTDWAPPARCVQCIRAF